MTLKVLIGIGLMCLPILSSATVTATVNQSQIAQTDIIDLTIQKSGSSHADADLSPLKQDFSVLGTSKGSSIQVINGNMTSSSTIQLQLSPKHTGQLTIPAITWDGERTQAIPVTVSQQAKKSASSNASVGSSTGQNGSGHVFFDIKPNKSPMFFGGARLLTVRLYTDQPLTQAGLSFPSNSTINVQQLGDDKNGTDVINGETYQTVERQYILTPQKSGSLTIDAPVLDAQVPDQSSNFGGQDPFFDHFFANSPLANMMSTRPMHLQANPIAIEVNPKPINISQQDWLPTNHLKLTENWDSDKAEITAGEPINLHLHLQANNINATQLPDLMTKLQLPVGIKAYPNQAKLETKVVDGQLLAIKDQDVALIGQSAGEFKLPAIAVSWWDTANNVLQKATVAARTLTILPSANGSLATATLKSNAPTTATTAPLKQQQEANQQTASVLNHWLTSPYQWVVLGLALLFITLVYVWIKFKNNHIADDASSAEGSKDSTQNTRAEKTISRSSALKTLQQAVSENNTKLARSALLDWAKTIWTESPPLGLIALADKVESPPLKDLILQLDRACYSSEIWQGDRLFELIRHWKAKTEGRTENKLIAELYV
jgi:hypothetical protein